MTNKEILQKAIEKAIEGGWFVFETEESEKDWINIVSVQDYRTVIYNRDFAKAFWGEELIWETYDEEYTRIAWEVHLREMVIEGEPLKYLEKFLNV